MFVVHLYVEGGQYDGEGFAVGPCDTREEADAECVELVEYGQADVLELRRFSDELISLLGPRDDGP